MGRDAAVPQPSPNGLSAESVNVRLATGFRTAARYFGLFVSLAGLAVLVGWVLEIRALQTIFPGLASMKPITASAFVLLGPALWLQSASKVSKREKALAQGCAGLAALFGLLTLAEYILAWNPGLDLILFPDRLAEPGVVFPGRMSAATALCALLLGLALALLDAKLASAQRVVGPFALLTGVVALIALIGYAYSVSSLYQIFPYSSMALHTAALFLLLSAGTAASRPERGLVAILVSNTAGGAVMRRLLPAGLLTPFIIGWIRLVGQQMGLYDTAFGVSIFALSNILIFAALIAWNARLLHQSDLYRRHDAQSLRESEERFRTVVETMPSAVVAIDVSGQIVMTNPMVEQLFGYDPIELLGKPLETLLPERFRGGHVEYWQGYLADPRPRPMGIGRDLFGRRKGGNEFPVEIGLSATRTSEGLLALAFISDISQRKLAEYEILTLNAELEQRVKERTAQLAKSEEKFFKIFWSSPAGISIASAADGRWIEVNEALTQMTGFSRDEMIGHTSAELGLVDPSAREKILQATRERGMVRNVEIQVKTKSGQTLDVLLSTEKIDLSGKPCVISIQYDITDRKLAEALIQQLNADLTQRQTALEAANEDLESFSYSVSHDLRAPLRSIDGFSRILEEDHALKLNKEGLRYLGLVRQSARQMGQLIDDLLAFSQLGRKDLDRQLVDMTTLAKDTLAEMPDDPVGKAHVHITDLPEVEADAALIRQVFVNLLSNALKFTRNTAKPRIDMGFDAQDEGVVYFVRDNGAGFDMQYATKLFGVFQRLHRSEEYEGTGVGLAIVQRIINRHGGRIWVNAAVGEGATFFFTIGNDIS